MSDPEMENQIAAARAYEELFVPALFRQWAPQVVEAGRIRPGDRVLDVACGTGVLAREAAARVGSTGSVAALDLSAGMLQIAAQISPGIEWRLGTAQNLPYYDESFDAVISQFGIMFFPDRSQAIGEMLRVLVHGGRLAVAVWGSLESTPGYADEAVLLQRLAGEKAAAAIRVPYVLGNAGQLSALFEGAGVTEVAVKTAHGTARFPRIRTMVEADLRGWLPLMGVPLEEEQIELILMEAEEALKAYAGAEGSVTFDAPALIVTGSKP
jgi:SAM-dependent methyltransferase